jgi:hypothetical protein
VEADGHLSEIMRAYHLNKALSDSRIQIVAGQAPCVSNVFNHIHLDPDPNGVYVVKLFGYRIQRTVSLIVTLVLKEPMAEHKPIDAPENLWPPIHMGHHRS